MYFSVIIPTYQRHASLLATLHSLQALSYERAFEVIVVVDGSTDGTAAAARDLAVPFPLHVVEQPRQGPGAARNRGAALARGRWLLFLDDDMRVDAALLTEHEKAFAAGAQAVIGHVPVPANAGASFVRQDTVAAWADDRYARLAAGGPVQLRDYIAGQFAIERACFERCGGFDETLPRSEDLDLALRLRDMGVDIKFCAEAVSWHDSAASPLAFLRERHHYGYSHALLARKYPQAMHDIIRFESRETMLGRWLGPWLRPAVLWLLDGGFEPRWLRDVFYRLAQVEYWAGVREAGGLPASTQACVLVYHAIADLAGHGRLAPYGVPPDEFARHMRTLQEWGYVFITPDELLRAQAGQGLLPRKSLLLTFDDAYASVRSVTDLLRRRGIPAVLFVVTGACGGTNHWDEGANGLPLLSCDELMTLTEQGFELGSHSRTHRKLTEVGAKELEDEVAGSMEEMVRAGLPRPRLFAYPYGAYDQRVCEGVRASGLTAAFTVDEGRAGAGDDLFVLPRVQILAWDRGWRFWLKVTCGGTQWLPSWLRRRLS
jgi:glycosyltransferase involved in cell wall biosynthesis/peptidoglycan/xylan/chitin deacetylase (PgdA/CDA1 family)